ncbi:MAG: hypothetical protein LBV52_05235 [Spirochaetaceae bacterium]|jgi:hypothetical protein|nr:hypothetical protein [Spirochaetaceae bacterium]
MSKVSLKLIALSLFVFVMLSCATKPKDSREGDAATAANAAVREMQNF